MIKVIISTNTNRKTVIVPAETTIRQLLLDNDIATGVGTISLDGVPVHPQDLDKRLKDMNVGESCFLTSIVKADNAR